MATVWVSVAPLLGLLGTVFGMIKTFNGLSAGGNSAMDVNAAGYTSDAVKEAPSGTQVYVTDADIKGDVKWTANNEYILTGFVFVEDGESLTIEAGTVVRGMPGQGAGASALVVARGGKIYAQGTAEKPIIFTALSDDLSDATDLGQADKGLWGGLIVLGKSTLNSPSANVVDGVITDNIEGIPVTEPRGQFGGNDEGDDSGVIRYVSIRHGGSVIGADNEINGLTLGRSTKHRIFQSI